MSPISPKLPRIRDARPDDRPVIVDFNARLALETEGLTLDRDVLDRGVALAFDRPDGLRYWLAEDPDAGRILGQTAISTEWSDWRCGRIWWLQSVYVEKDARGRGVFRALHEHIRETAKAAGDVVGLRLYMETHNHRARATYESLGFKPCGYEVFEEIWPSRLS